ncbi:MAG: hypothetical protein LBV71_02845 [Prevotella sp.]|jgi:hypothetical protein|nr:hypothetical protein [Prevotella sp.]
MKKLFFVLFATILFASCSSESDDTTVPEGKTYKVTFNVSNFDMETKPLKAESLGQALYYTIYEKESGKAIKFRYHNRSAGNAQVVEDLPAGSYYIVFISAYRALDGININWTEDPDGANVDITNLNFYTDYCYGSTYIAYPAYKHYGLYYEKVSFTVGVGNEEVNKDVELQPKWSNISVQITDGETCTLPEGTTLVDISISPLYYGFNIADGIPSKNYGEDLTAHFQSLSATSVSDFREKGLSNKFIMASKGATAKLVFIKHTMSTTEILGERVIYKGDFEGGKKITLKGTLGNTVTNASFNLSLGELKDGGVIPFE